MTSGYPIQLRLNAEKYKIFEALAALEHKPLATFIREKLEAEIDLMIQFKSLHDDIATLRSQVGILQKKEEDKNAETDNIAFLLEILLLLRSIAGPDRISMVASEIKRNGFEIWHPKD